MTCSTVIIWAERTKRRWVFSTISKLTIRPTSCPLTSIAKTVTRPLMKPRLVSTPAFHCLTIPKAMLPLLPHLQYLLFPRHRQSLLHPLLHPYTSPLFLTVHSHRHCYHKGLHRSPIHQSCVLLKYVDVSLPAVIHTNYNNQTYLNHLSCYKTLLHHPQHQCPLMSLTLFAAFRQGSANHLHLPPQISPPPPTTVDNQLPLSD